MCFIIEINYVVLTESCEREKSSWGLLPCVGFTGMCRWTGYGFWPLCPKQGISNFMRLCPKQGLNCPKQGMASTIVVVKYGLYII